MHYRYSVLSETGNEIRGILEGSSLDIKKALKEKNYYLLSLEPDLLRSLRALLEKRRIKPRALSIFFEDLLNMLKTGMAITEAMAMLEESSTEAVLKRALSRINEDLINGFSLAAAAERTKAFPWLVLSMLKVGEKSGSLEQVLDDLAKYYCREADFGRSLRNAVSYPLVVICLLIAVMFYVSFKVIPHLETLLPLKENAYFATRLLLSASHFLKDFWFACLLLPLVATFIYAKFKRSSNERIADSYYKLPIAGQLLKDLSFSALFSSLAVLQRNGISIADSLALIEETTPYKFLARKILKVRDFITSGLSFWQALEQDSFFTSNICSSVRKGEEMGSLDSYLENLSRYYFNRVTRRIQVILGFIQPVLLVFCAGVLLVIISAFIIPVYGNLSNIASGNVKF